ncbi:MAG: aminotransferase class I/II-fold pyridoxal phosphate-dependent enzyme, partial [Robiginitomaculum sp.]|nr:aminotransferase class I/II-fold pyridoxal phosphate-dependent enzyme [Robiginitomaculum sp.]
MTKKWPYNIARKAVVDLKPYAARGGATTALHLDANESPWAPPPVTGADGYNRYPEQQPVQLIQRLADLYDTLPERLMVGRGADEAIEVLLRTFCETGKDSILICPPTFGYYATCADIQGAGVIKAPLNDDFSYNEIRIRSALSKGGETLKI